MWLAWTSLNRWWLSTRIFHNPLRCSLHNMKYEHLVAGSINFFLNEYMRTVLSLVSVPFSRVNIKLKVALGFAAAVTWAPNWVVFFVVSLLVRSGGLCPRWTLHENIHWKYNEGLKVWEGPYNSDFRNLKASRRVSSLYSGPRSPMLPSELQMRLSSSWVSTLNFSTKAAMGWRFESTGKVGVILLVSESWGRQPN